MPAFSVATNGDLACFARGVSVGVAAGAIKRERGRSRQSGSVDTLEFSALTGVHPMIEKYPLSRVAEAYERMQSGKVRFRVVLIMGV